MSTNAYLTAVLTLFISGCALVTKTPSVQPGTQVTVMEYNVENLFDTQQDADREDYTFIPARLKVTQEHKVNCQKMQGISRKRDCLEMDWNERVLERKLKRLAEVIQDVNDGHGPDILILEEVENINVLNMLNAHLKKANYKSVVLLEGPDVRGIDIGMLSRFPLDGEAVLHKVPFQPKSEDDKVWMARSRGVLQATFILPNGERLTAFGVHFPSLANPTYWREQVIEFLATLKNQLPKDRMTLVAGDFNISSEEDGRHGLFRDKLGKDWLISHYIGCQNCLGTHNFARNWSFLDAILVDPRMSPSGTMPWYIDPASIEVINNHRYQTSSNLTPAAYHDDSAVGVSDHYPIKAVLKLRQPNSAASVTK